MIFIIPLIMVVGFLGWLLRPGWKPTASRRIAILTVVIPVLAAAAAAITFQILQNLTGTIEVSNISNAYFIVGLAFIGISILTAIGLAAVHKVDIARGAGFGVCIAVIIAIIELGLLEWLGGV